MSKKLNLGKFTDDDFDEYDGGTGELMPARPTRSKPRPVKRSRYAVLDEKLRYGEISSSQADGVFTPTFSSSHHEREWILDYLGTFYDGKIITDVLHQVTGGKEATVYCCAAHPDTGMELIAAKIYRPRMFRNLRNDAMYRAGRPILDEMGKEIRDERMLRAVKQGTRIGKRTMHTSWLEHEFQTLRTLYAAGVHVPRPVASSDNAILMEYVGSTEQAAPTLSQVRVGKDEARVLLDELLVDIEQMLARGHIHGDLSAYNVLYWEGAFRIIDFPQSINPWTHPDAWFIFHRDLVRLCGYFGRLGLACPVEEIAASMWQRQGLPPLTERLRELALNEVG